MNGLNLVFIYDVIKEAIILFALSGNFQSKEEQLDILYVTICARFNI